MDSLAIQDLVIHTLEDYKALDITTLDVRELTDITDAMIICSGTSKRHLQTLSEQLVLNAKKNGLTPTGIEGTEQGEWILVDLVDVVVHIMLPETREFYSLEKLWSTAARLREKKDAH